MSGELVSLDAFRAAKLAARPQQQPTQFMVSGQQFSFMVTTNTTGFGVWVNAGTAPNGQLRWESNGR
jgi:hypothetical protein